METLSCSLDVYQQMYQCKLDLRVSRRNDLSAQADLLCDQLSPQLLRAFEAAFIIIIIIIISALQ